MSPVQGEQKQIHLGNIILNTAATPGTIELGYQAHALTGITVKRYVLHNEVRQILGVEG